MGIADGVDGEPLMPLNALRQPVFKTAPHRDARPLLSVNVHARGHFRAQSARSRGRSGPLATAVRGIPGGYSPGLTRPGNSWGTGARRAFTSCRTHACSSSHRSGSSGPDRTPSPSVVCLGDLTYVLDILSSDHCCRVVLYGTRQRLYQQSNSR